jgi:hypothetical protein
MFAWTDRDLALLERLRASTDTDVLKATIRNGKRAIQATQHVGVVRLGNHTIQVLPKIYQARETESEKTKTRDATANLLRMLAYAGCCSVLSEVHLAVLERVPSIWRMQQLLRNELTTVKPELAAAVRRHFAVTYQSPDGVDKSSLSKKSKTNLCSPRSIRVRAYDMKGNFTSFGAVLCINKKVDLLIPDCTGES